MTKFIIDTLDYFFSFNPPTSFGLQWVVWIAVGLAVICAFYLVFLVKTTKDSHFRKVTQEYPGKFLTLSFLLLINLFSRFNRIEVLSMRFITYVLLIWIIYCFYSLYQNLTVTLPENRQQQKPAIHNLEQQYHIHRNKKKKNRLKR